MLRRLRQRRLGVAATRNVDAAEWLWPLDERIGASREEAPGSFVVAAAAANEDVVVADVDDADEPEVAEGRRQGKGRPMKPPPVWKRQRLKAESARKREKRRRLPLHLRRRAEIERASGCCCCCGWRCRYR